MIRVLQHVVDDESNSRVSRPRPGGRCGSLVEELLNSRYCACALGVSPLSTNSVGSEVGIGTRSQGHSYCWWPSLRGALCTRYALALRRVSGVVHPRALCNCALETLQRAASLLACAWLQSPSAPRTCAPYIGALLTSVSASVSLSSLCTKLCRFSPLRLCTYAPLHLCSALLSVLLSSQHCSRRSSAFVSVLLFSLLWSSRSLLYIRLYSSLRLCTCVCFRLGLTRRVALYTSGSQTFVGKCHLM